MKNYKIINLIFFWVLFAPFFAFSQELQGKFHDWSVFKITNQGKTFCYAASLPINISGNIQKTGEAFFLVTKKTYFFFKTDFLAQMRRTFGGLWAETNQAGNLQKKKKREKTLLWHRSYSAVRRCRGGKSYKHFSAKSLPA